jgi:hypothetical protein
MAQLCLSIVLYQPGPSEPRQSCGGQGIEKCPNTDLDMYYCIDHNMGNVNCSAQHQVLIFQGMSQPDVRMIAGGSES